MNNIRDYERLGLNLSADVRKKVEFLKTSIGELCIEFQQNMNEENLRLYFTESKLARLPVDFIKELTLDSEGKLEINLKFPHYFPIMEQCKVAMRNAIAQLLGHKNHARYALAMRMAKSPVKVKIFLENISNKISPLAKKELAKLEVIKREEEGDEPFGFQDFRYYI